MELCEHCGASLKQRWDRITAGEVDFLIKFRDRVIEKEENLVNVPQEMTLSNIEYSDFQKLRFHALIAKKKENGTHRKGWWVLTHRGNLFVKGEIKIPEKVRVFRNAITGYSDNEVGIEDVMGTEPYWDTQADIVFEPATEDVIEESNAKRIKRERKKKGKKYCPKCETQLKIKIEENPFRKVYVCPDPDCGYQKP